MSEEFASFLKVNLEREKKIKEYREEDAKKHEVEIVNLQRK
jgi:hypothetical protein